MTKCSECRFYNAGSGWGVKQGTCTCRERPAHRDFKIIRKRSDKACKYFAEKEESNGTEK